LNKEKLYEFCETVDLFKLRYAGKKQSLLALLNVFSSKPIIARKYYQREAAKRMVSLVKEKSIDLVHFDMLHLSEYLLHFQALPCILVNHNVESLRLLRWAKITSNLLLKAFLGYQYLKLKKYEKKKCPQFSSCTVVSGEDKQILMNLCGKDNFHVIPNGVDTAYFKAASDSEKKRNQVVWVGAMTNPYNRDAVDFFLHEIWPLVHLGNREARAFFVGKIDNETRKSWQKKVGVEFVGYVDDVRPYVARATIFIAPLRSGSGTKIKVLNAMAQGKAVVTTSIGAEGILAENGKGLLIENEPEQFARAILSLLADDNFIEKLGSNAVALVKKNYSWDVINSNLLSYYRNFDGKAL